ncbi:hypothetical protein BM523_12280 [Alteromonas mediterranea]|uniref:carboxypeptidase-like regulatory domain-containing protein n=1 Tax=Alteromonas mediterranea TaxID=314275 RepID=UPI000903E29B|nr:carboxypeptidase-like regulatory domain-containing protein [Alteromonas mediterranea]APD94722.1 hypothetical protein BM523_12280 [Alteromonas mediterranea]APD98358.1 hypothetical protein BM525_12345 [Alteromonas mediterranea]
MKINKKLAPIPLFVSLALTGCIEVDDDSNDGVVDALNQQNAVLTEQNNLLAEQIENNQTSVTLAGAVVDTRTDTPLVGLNVTVYQGNTLVAEGVTSENGGFNLEGLPASADLTVVVSSTDESYLERAFFITTGPVDSGEGYDDIGIVGVSAPVEVEFSVTDAQSGEAISGLSFIGFSFSGSSTSNVFDFAHESEFNDETQTYQITLPRDLNVTLRANIDIDDDGEADFDFTNNGNVNISGDTLFIYEASEFTEGEISLSQHDEAAAEEKTVVISLIDNMGEPLAGAEFMMDMFEDTYTSEYDEESGSYELVVPFDGGISFEMSSFQVGDITYSTGSINLSRSTRYATGETSINVNTSGFESNSYYSVADSEIINLVLVPTEVEPQATVEVITTNVNPSSFAYSVYYSEAVDIDLDEVSLTYDQVSIVRGNESADDSVPNGYTYILSEEASVELSQNVALSGVKHTFTPANELQANTNYRFAIGEVSPTSGGVSANVYGDDYSFTTPTDETAEFDINALKLDNSNFYSNGSVIVSENTAGVSNSANNYGNSVSILLPTSVESLNYLIINFESYTEYGNQYAFVNSYELVRDENIFMQRQFAINVAQNESISNQSGMSYLRGTTVADGEYIYRDSIGLYLEDNTAENPVSATFSYEYQTKAGENASGKLTLPIL